MPFAPFSPFIAPLSSRPLLRLKEIRAIEAVEVPLADPPLMERAGAAIARSLERLRAAVQRGDVSLGIHLKDDGGPPRCVDARQDPPRSMASNPLCVRHRNLAHRHEGYRLLRLRLSQ